MNSQEKIQALENDIPVNELWFLGIPLWPILKPQLFFKWRNENQSSPKKVSNLDAISSAATQVLTILRNVPELFRSCEVLISSDSFERRRINGVWRNKIFFQILDQYSETASYFERAVIGSPASQEKGIVPLFTIQALIKIISLFSRKNKFSFNIPSNTVQLVAEVLWHKKWWGWILGIKKPKYILFSDYYNPTHFGLIMAAKARSIPVVEFQHGIITRLHPAYDFPVFKDRTLMPDYLAFYVLEKDIPESFYIDPSRTINIGHAYLEWALSQTKKPAWASSRKVVVVTLQYGYYDSVIKVVEEAAKLATDYYFVIAPRMPHDEVTIASLHNIHIERNLSFFECLPFADFHSTFSSTCTLEAFMTGVPTIVIAIDEIAEKYYRQFPLEGMIEYVSDGKQFANALKRVVPDSKKHKHVDHLKGIQNLLFCLEAKLRRAEISDARFIYDLRFSPDVVAVSMTTDIPSYENHLRWFTDNFNSPNRDFFIVTHDGKNIGVIRYDWDTHTSAFVSIFFSPECRGKGLGKIALSLGEEKLKSSGKNGVIKAVVKDDNTQSLQMFLNAGYVRSGEHLGKTIT